MRAILAMFVFVAGLLVLTTAVYTRDLRFPRLGKTVFLKHRTKLKDSCGFKPSKISTAYAFGKRGVPESSEYKEELTPEKAPLFLWERVQRNLPENKAEIIPFAERLIMEMAKINADNERTLDERKLTTRRDESNEEQPMVVDLP